MVCFVPCVICILSETFQISKNGVCASSSGMYLKLEHGHFLPCPEMFIDSIIK
jgi:hypothetical protein